MQGVHDRPYSLLSDHARVYRFMLDTYERDWRNGVPAPYLEYALCSSWMDVSYTHRWRLWLKGGDVVAFCFAESPATDVYFNLLPGYEALADEMIAYARERMPDQRNKQRLILFKGQTALIEAARARGYAQAGGHTDWIYPFDKPLAYPLPRGYRFVPAGQMDISKASLCCWQGFGHEESEGAWDGDTDNALRLLTAPHATPDLAVAVESEAGEYACYAGMWWTPENHLAYLEPLCTAPAHRRRGLASAALSELYRRVKPLGATHMTGGAHPFYAAIGCQPMIERLVFAKHPAETK